MLDDVQRANPVKAIVIEWIGDAGEIVPDIRFFSIQVHIYRTRQIVPAAAEIGDPLAAALFLFHVTRPCLLMPASSDRSSE